MSGLSTSMHSYKIGEADEIQCLYCDSKDVRFVDFDRIIKRIDDKKIVVTEIWICRMCGKEFGRPGTLFSPQDVNRIKLRIAFLTWGGYSVGALLAYALYFKHLI